MSSWLILKLRLVTTMCVGMAFITMCDWFQMGTNFLGPPTKTILFTQWTIINCHRDLNCRVRTPGPEEPTHQYPRAPHIFLISKNCQLLLKNPGNRHSNVEWNERLLYFGNLPDRLSTYFVQGQLTDDTVARVLLAAHRHGQCLDPLLRKF